MAEPILAVTWGIPVDIAQLGAHLEAHLFLKRNINMLRLCNRFGKGDKAFINILPIEMISMIETFMMPTDQAKFLRQWQYRMRRFATEARHPDEIDPLDRTMLKEEIFRAAQEQDPFFMFCPLEGNIKCADDIDDDDEILWEWGLGDRESAPQLNEKMEWIRHVSRCTEGRLGQILREDFGLEAFVLYEALDHVVSRALDLDYEVEDYNVATMCFLTLPSASEESSIECLWHVDEYIQFHIGSCAQEQQDCLVLDKNDRQCFTRAMERLDLDISVHPSQLKACASAYAQPDGYHWRDLETMWSYDFDRNRFREALEKTKAGVERLEGQDWPQLVMLAKQSRSLFDR